MSAMTSPLDLLEQHGNCNQLIREHGSASAAVADASQLPANRGIYCKRLNLFYRTPKPAACALANAELAAKSKALDEAKSKFEKMKQAVVGERSQRKQRLTEMATAAAAAESQGFAGEGEEDSLFEGFGEGERVQVFGLEKAKDVNGCAGEIVKYEAGRFVVMLDGRDKGVRIKPENLRPLPREPGNSAFTGVVKERT